MDGGFKFEGRGPEEEEELVENSEEEEEEDSKDDEDNSQSEGGSGKKNKHKRRSKNDDRGRDFICGCSKRYLSYPALYTHIKTKHGGITPPGTNTSQFQTGRGRGRPRKIAKAIEQRAESSNFGLGGLGGMKSGKFGANMGGVLSQIEQNLTGEKLAKEQAWIEKLGVKGGPTNPTEWFSENLHGQGQISQEDQLYSLVQEQAHMIEMRQIQRSNRPHDDDHASYGRATKYLIQMSEEELKDLKIDQILALFLVDYSEKVIVNFYKTMVVFVELYRDWINFEGWNLVSKYKILNVGEKPPQYSSVKSGESIPQFANDFIQRYLPLKCNIFDQKLAISLTEALCQWLLNRSLTTLRLCADD